MAQERADNRQLLLLDTGDAWVGGRYEGTTTAGDRTEGELVLKAMNALAYDAMALGEFELRLPSESLRARLAAAEFPVLSANAYWAGGQRVTEPYVVLSVAGHRIGVIGVTRPPAEAIAGVEVREPRAALEAVLAEVAAGAGTIVVLTSIGLDGAQSLVADLPAVDLVVAARPWPLPDHALRIESTGALVVSAEAPTAGHTGRRVGRLQVTLGSDGTLADEAWSTLSLGKNLADDAAMIRLLGEENS